MSSRPVHALGTWGARGRGQSYASMTMCALRFPMGPRLASCLSTGMVHTRTHAFTRGVGRGLRQWAAPATPHASPPRRPAHPMPRTVQAEYCADLRVGW